MAKNRIFLYILEKSFVFSLTFPALYGTIFLLSEYRSLRLTEEMWATTGKQRANTGHPYFADRLGAHTHVE